MCRYFGSGFLFWLLLVPLERGKNNNNSEVVGCCKEQNSKGNNVMEYGVGIQFNADLKEFSSHWAAEIISYSAF